MKRKIMLSTIIIFTLLLSGCIHKNKTDITKVPSLNTLYNKAMKDYKNKKYNRAINEFKIIMFQYPGSNKMEAAQFYIGESYFNMKEYTQAINEYSFFINSFVGSKYIEKAKFKMALCYFLLSPPPTLDQSNTRKAENMLSEFIALYPDSPEADSAKAMIKKCHLKYLEKTLDAAVLYYKMGEYKSAYIYIKKAMNMKDHDLVSGKINSLLKKINKKLPRKTSNKDVKLKS